MSNNQLRWHLLREMSEILVKKLQPPDLAPLSTLLLAGKGPAQAVKVILSQNFHVTMIDKDYYFVNLDEKEFEIEVEYFKKLGLRWARSLSVSKQKPWSPGDFIDRGDVVPELFPTFRDYNSVETLSLDSDSECWNAAISIIKACPKLSSLDYDQKLLYLLLQREDVDFLLIRSIKVLQCDLKDEDGYPVNFPECKRTFEALAKRCPNLETLTVDAEDEVINLLLCLSGIVIPSVKSFTLDTWNDFHDPACFSFLLCVTSAFPNVENFCLINSCFYFEGNLDKVLRTFKKYGQSFDFNFDCHIHFHKQFSTNAEWNNFYKELETIMCAYGSIPSIVKDSHGRYDFEATMLLPHKAMVFHIKVRNAAKDR